QFIAHSSRYQISTLSLHDALPISYPQNSVSDKDCVPAVYLPPPLNVFSSHLQAHHLRNVWPPRFLVARNKQTYRQNRISRSPSSKGFLDAPPRFRYRSL